MVRCLKISRNRAETARKKLVSKGLLNQSYEISEKNGFIYLPLKTGAALSNEKIVQFPCRKKPTKIKTFTVWTIVTFTLELVS